MMSPHMAQLYEHTHTNVHTHTHAHTPIVKESLLKTGVSSSFMCVCSQRAAAEEEM